MAITLQDYLAGAIERPPVVSGKAGRNAAATARVARQQLPYLLSAILGSAQAQTPAYAQSLFDLYRDFAPQYASIAGDVSRQNQQQGAATDLELLQTYGKDIAGAITEADRVADPEYYATRGLLADKSAALLGAQDPTQLTGSEMANVERGLNRLYPNNIPTSTGALRGAAMFGDALGRKQSNLANTITQVGSLLNSFRSGNFNFNQATGKSGLANEGSGLFAQAAGIGDKAFGLGSNLLGQSAAINMNERQIASQQVPGWERIVGALPDYS